MGGSLHELADRIKRRGLILLISDLMDDPESVLLALKHFRHKKHEVVVFHVLDPAEITFPFRDETGFVDLETGKEITTSSWEIARDYRARFGAWSENYRRRCQENRIDYVLMDTSTPFDRALLRYLEKRRKLH